MDSAIQRLNNWRLLFYIGLSSTVETRDWQPAFSQVSLDKTGSYIMEISTNLGYLDS